MRALVAFSIILLILLSGCANQATEKEPSETTAQTRTQAEIIEGTTVEVTKSTEPSGPKTYQVNVVQGIGIKEESG